jgi:hypothetical protein
VKIEDFKGKQPAFVLEKFFAGRLRGWGVTLGRMGGLQDRFTVDAQGTWDSLANVLSLKEDYTFDDGHTDQLTWAIIKRGEGQYDGRETLIDGTAKGEQQGNAFRWRYQREVPSSEGSKTKFGFDDWFFLHDTNHMSAHASLTKLGVEVATLNAFYEKVI